MPLAGLNERRENKAWEPEPKAAAKAKLWLLRTVTLGRRP